VRAFLAVDLDAATIAKVAATGESLRGHRALARARWVARDTMHVTLRFLGEIDEAKVLAFAALVPRLGARAAIAIAGAKVIAFPDARRARVLAVEIEEPSGALAAMACEAEAAAVALGLAPEERAYRPHVTLARMKEPADVREVLATRIDVGGGRIVSVALFESVLGKSGRRYTSLARCDLT
jgi:2'-5' RNA ligase